jgi:flagellar motor protein MotB
MRRPIEYALAILIVFCVVSSARAQCDRACPRAERDENGCCPRRPARSSECPSYQHRSSGHCCPDAAEWEPGLSDCVCGDEAVCGSSGRGAAPSAAHPRIRSGRAANASRAAMAEQARAEQSTGIASAVMPALRPLIDSGMIRVTLRAGMLLVVIPTGVLFETGSDRVSPTGRDVLARVTAGLRSLAARISIIVNAHTDNVPIRAPGGNVELSMRRAIAIDETLTSGGLRSEGAMGHGEFAPVNDNASAEGRERNRRVELEIIAAGE